MAEQSRTVAGEKETKRDDGNVYSKNDMRERRFFCIAFTLILAAIAVWIFIGVKIL